MRFTILVLLALSAAAVAADEAILGYDESVSVRQREAEALFDASIDSAEMDGWLKQINDRLVEVIDDLLATPDIEDPVRLVRPHVLYEFADPELEALSSGQKLLLRIGSEHRSHVKERLREFRNIVTRM